jgi:hypothetical protein
MSCWVVPSVAAELWGCTVDAVLAAMRNGNVPTKEDAGWTFVDVAPDSPTLESTNIRFDAVAASSVVTQEEKMALVGDRDQDDRDADMEGDWRSIRQTVSASRRAPLAKAA